MYSIFFLFACFSPRIMVPSKMTVYLKDAATIGWSHSSLPWEEAENYGARRGRIMARFEKDLTHVVSTKEDKTPHLEIMRKVNCASQHLGNLNQTCLTDLTVAQAVF